VGVKRRLVELAAVGAVLAALGFVFAQTPRPAGLPEEISYRGLAYYGFGSDDPNNPGTLILSCFVRPANFTKGRNDRLPRGYAPFHRVGSFLGDDLESHPILVPHYERHRRVPSLVMVPEGSCFREYDNSVLIP
jgi:hypothetical protein